MIIYHSKKRIFILFSVFEFFLYDILTTFLMILPAFQEFSFDKFSSISLVSFSYKPVISVEVVGRSSSSSISSSSNSSSSSSIRIIIIFIIIMIIIIIITNFIAVFFLRLPLSALTRLLNTHNIPILLVELVENPPWTSRKHGKAGSFKRCWWNGM